MPAALSDICECSVMHFRSRIRAAAMAAFSLYLGLFPGSVWAGSFQVSPVRVELSSQRSTEALSVRNSGSEAVVIQLKTVEWAQDGGRDVYHPSDDLVVTPPIFIVQPGATQIIRVGLLRGVDETRELSYRLFLQEVPSNRGPDAKGLQMLLRIGLPVFVMPRAKVAPVLKWHLERADTNQLKVVLHNEGNAHIQVADFSLTLPGKPRPLAVQQVSTYLLNGQSRRWILATDAAQSIGSDTVRINAYTDAGRVEADIKLEQP